MRLPEKPLPMIISGSLPDRYPAPSHIVRLHRAGGGGGNCYCLLHVSGWLPDQYTAPSHSAGPHIAGGGGGGCFASQDGCPTNILHPTTAQGRGHRPGRCVGGGLVDRKWPTAPGESRSGGAR